MAYTTEIQGFLGNATERIRDALDMGSQNTKWTDSKLYPYIINSWADLMKEITANADNRIVVGHTITLSRDTSIYQLPSNFGKFIRLVRVNESSGYHDEHIVPRSRLNPHGAGIMFEGNTLRVEPKWSGTTEALLLEYVPDGSCTIHTGELDMSHAAVSATTLMLDTSPSEGYYDRRSNAYVGYVIRLLQSVEIDAPAGYNTFPIMERIITANSDGVITLNSALDIDPTEESLGNVTYEIVPFLGQDLEEPLVWRVAQKIATIEDNSGRSGRPSRFQNLYLQELRNIRLSLANKNTRTGGKWNHDVPGGSMGWSVGNGFYAY